MGNQVLSNGQSQIKSGMVSTSVAAASVVIAADELVVWVGDGSIGRDLEVFNTIRRCRDALVEFYVPDPIGGSEVVAVSPIGGAKGSISITNQASMPAITENDVVVGYGSDFLTSGSSRALESSVNASGDFYLEFIRGSAIPGVVPPGSFLIDSINALAFIEPESGQPGLDKITDTELFTLSGGGAESYVLGPDGQPMMRMTGAQNLVLAPGALLGSFLRELHNQMQFWFMVTWDPRAAVTTFRELFQTAGGATAGIRLRAGGTTGTGQLGLNDGTTNFTMTQPQGVNPDFDVNEFNTILVQVDMVNRFMEAWTNSFSQRSLSQHRRPFPGAMAFPAPGAPLANTFVAELGGASVSGDYSFACGENIILTPDQVQQLMQWGGGRSHANASAAIGTAQRAWRLTASENTMRVAGNFSEDPIINVYADTGRTTRGALLATSTTPVARDAQGFMAWESPAVMTADALVKVHAAYADGSEDRRRGRVKILPAARSGMDIGFWGCGEFDPRLSLDNSLGTEGLVGSLFQTIRAQNLDTFVSMGDDGYPDNEWVNAGNAGFPETRQEMTDMHLAVFDNHILDNLFSHVSSHAGPYSDHDGQGNDIDGATATNQAEVRAHLMQRYGVVFPLVGNNYRVFQTPGITYISLDTRAESQDGVQLTSVAQRAQMQTDMTAAVARGDLIFLLGEKPFNPGATPPNAQAWHNASYAAERTNIFDRMVTANAHLRTIVVSADYHATGVDLSGTTQGGFDAGGICLPPSITVGRLNHDFGESSGVAWPSYFDNGSGHWVKINVVDNAAQFDLTITPYEINVAKTPLTRTIG